MIRVALLLLCFFTPALLAANSGLQSEPSVAVVPLVQSDLNDGWGSLYIDKEQQLSIEDILALPSSEFDRLLNPVSLGYKNWSFWLRGNFYNQQAASHPLLVEVPMPYLDYIDLYLIQEGKIVDLQRLGDATNVRYKRSRNAAFLVAFPPGQSQLLVNIRTSTNTVSNLKLYSEMAFNQSQRWRSFFDGIFYTFVASTLLVSLYNFLSQRTLTSGYFFAYYALNLSKWLFVSGVIHQLFIWQSPLLNSQLTALSISLSSLFAALFFERLFAMRRYHRINYYAVLVTIASSIVVTVSTLLGFYQETAPLLLLSGLISLLLSPSLIWRQFKKPLFEGKLLAISHTIYVTSLGYFILVSLGSVPYFEWYIEAVTVALLAQSALLFSSLYGANKLKAWRARSFLKHAHQQEGVAQRLSDLGQLNLDRFALLSHEIKNPLAQMKLAMQLNQQGRASLSQDSFLHLISRVENAMAHAATDIDSEETLTYLSVSGVLAESLGANIDSANVQVNYSAQEQLIHSDRTGLRMILDNLIENALKYREGRRDSVKITVSSESGSVQVTIENPLSPGVELDVEQLGRKHYRSPSHQRISGDCVGLYLVKNLCKDLGIEIEFYLDSGNFVAKLTFPQTH